jgi:hypothetical protein|tara:strand:+ start:125 stop:277 length:153 start_codon:yes stop_codon:yes gene_type:complete
MNGGQYRFPFLYTIQHMTINVLRRLLDQAQNGFELLNVIDQYQQSTTPRV